MTAATIGTLFIGLAVLFVGATMRDALGSDPRPIAQKTWLRIAFIFSAVGIGLQFVNLLH
jgi:hypothetical protein